MTTSFPRRPSPHSFPLYVWLKKSYIAPSCLRCSNSFCLDSPFLNSLLARVTQRLPGICLNCILIKHFINVCLFFATGFQPPWHLVAAASNSKPWRKSEWTRSMQRQIRRHTHSHRQAFDDAIFINNLSPDVFLYTNRWCFLCLNVGLLLVRLVYVWFLFTPTRTQIMQIADADDASETNVAHALEPVNSTFGADVKALSHLHIFSEHIYGA